MHQRKEIQHHWGLLRGLSIPKWSKNCSPILSLTSMKVAKYWGAALLVTARKGDIEVVDLILQDGLVEPNCADCFRKTALWWAAYNGHTEVARRLVQSCRVSVNIVYHCDTLLAAECEGHREITQLLQAVRSSTTPSINNTARSTRQRLLSTRS